MSRPLQPALDALKSLNPSAVSALKKKNLPAVLSRLPSGPVRGTRVTQRRWHAKGLSVTDEDTYWTVTRTKLNVGAPGGKVWGRLTWKCKDVTKGEEERVKGALKFDWRVIGEEPASARASREQAGAGKAEA